MSEIETEEGATYQYRFAFDGVGNQGEWSRGFADPSICERYAQEESELFDRFGLTPAIQYRVGTWTKTTEWSPYSTNGEA